MAHSYKRTSLLLYKINYARKKFYFTGQKEKIKVKFFKVNLWQQKINTKIFATHELRTCDSGDSGFSDIGFGWKIAFKKKVGTKVIFYF
jgi:hypothetical protein